VVSKRRAAAEQAAKSVGGKIESFYFAFGDADAFVIADVPDHASASAASLAVSASGGAHCKTIVLMTPEEVDASVSSPFPMHDPTPSTWTSRNELRNTNAMAPRRARKRSRSPSQKRRGDYAEDFDLRPSTEVPFSAPWHGAPKDEFSTTAHLWPIELFEAFYGVLWKAVSKKDPKWARGFHAALMEQVMSSAGSAEEIVERLAGFDYAQKAGRPKGSGDVIQPAPLLRLYDPLLDRVQLCRQGPKRYAPQALAALRRFWTLWRRQPGLPPPRVKDFPTHTVKAALERGDSPRDLTSLMVAAWFGVREPENIPKYVQRARRALGLPPLTL